MHYSEVSMDLARLRVEDRLQTAERERRATEALRAGPNFVPTNRWRDVAYYSMVVGSIAALGFVGWFAQQLIAAA